MTYKERLQGRFLFFFDPLIHWQEAQAGLMCGHVTSLPPSVREVLLLWGVGAARRAAWASVTAWRHTVVLFPAVKFNPDSQKMGPLHKLLLKLLCLCSLCVSPFLPFSFVSVLLCPLSWELHTRVRIISVWIFALCSGAFFIHRNDGQKHSFIA